MAQSIVEDAELLFVYFAVSLLYCDYEVHSSIGLPRERQRSSVERLSFPVFFTTPSITLYLVTVVKAKPGLYPLRLQGGRWELAAFSFVTSAVNILSLC